MEMHGPDRERDLDALSSKAAVQALDEHVADQVLLGKRVVANERLERRDAARNHDTHPHLGTPPSESE
jgi:hypothetical protein